MSDFTNVQSSQPGAGPLSLHDILSTAHNGSLGSGVHPLVLEAVVQVVLSKTDAEPPAGQAEHTSINVEASKSSANPYWHLTQMPVHSFNVHSSQQWSPPTYEAFWSNFERNKPTSYARTASHISTQNTTLIPTWSTITPRSLSPQSYPGLSSSSSPSSVSPSPADPHAPPPESPSHPIKRKASSIDEVIRDYSALADFIRVVPGSPKKRIDPFPCNRCRKTVGGDLSAVRSHLVDEHATPHRKAPAICIFPGCDKSVASGNVGSHIANHQAHERARCGLCGKGFTRSESAVLHITAGTCQVLKAVTATEDSQRPQKRPRH